MTKPRAQTLAEAAGISVCIDDGIVWRKPDKEWDGLHGRRYLSQSFAPEELEQDAILLAERFGLFDVAQRGARLTYCDGLWRVDSLFGELSVGSTFCEAICRAVERLAGGAT